MEVAILTALGVGGATVIGSVMGFIFKDLSHKFSDVVMAFAAGVMLSASVIGLILPSLDYGGRYGLIITIVGIFVGAISLNFLDRVVPHLHNLIGDEGVTQDSARMRKVLLFVSAIAIHNLPEGVAAGVGFGSGDMSQAFVIAGGIVLQNIPEGMIIIGPMLAAGISSKKAFICALFTGLVEVVGTLIGYFTVNIATVFLPFALAFAGGTMMYVVTDEMLSDAQVDENRSAMTYALIIGFCVVLVLDYLLG